MDVVVLVEVLPFNHTRASAINMSVEFYIVMVSASVVVVLKMKSLMLRAAAPAHALKFVAIPPLTTTARGFVIVTELSRRRAVRGHGLG